ncbi:glycoside hydrolase family 1 protein [Chryseosolibacter indicus]|uniref:Family 1 glycosylhydrolase n=1 Tax=Chryseosolibacter indicus TaxID=2782351 RepID=A0ABS5VM59_9BACT|nr:family 1 glycosylhydrolase [Chryseosolibacter indicus]MBT1702535.1 family 1 glycosylhydrolase [Chryseosolibacter indicus]
MKLIFPGHFQFGTSTAAYQIETAYEHDWQGVVARDGHVFDRTTDHEKRYDEDIDIIASLAPHYRMSLMWSRLQQAPLADFDESVKREYHQLLQKLKQKNVSIMMVLHHFTNPIWFAKAGGWSQEANVNLWVDFAKKVVDEYGSYVTSWNTFNEPNLYTSLGWVVAEFPPFKRNILEAKKVLNNIGVAHDIVYDYIKHKYPDTPVGISHNCTIFAGENIMGVVPAKFYDYMFMEYALKFFTKFDFFGMSYYARIGFDPLPITRLLTPEKMAKSGKPHDDMWEYYPQGLGECIRRYWNQYKKPIIITENGICTGDDTKRVAAIKDYLSIVYDAIQDGVDVQGYYHWSAWDNFEWNLGLTYKFGLYECNLETKDRTRKPSADLYSAIAFNRVLGIDEVHS